MRDEPLHPSSNGRQTRSLPELTGQGKAPVSMVRAAGMVSALTLVSRVLGLVREQVFAMLLGAGDYADAFNTAFRLPNLLRDLFAEGALSSAFIPTYARAMEEGGRARAHQLSSRLLTLLAVALGGLVLIGLVFAAPFVHALAPGFAAVPGKLDTTVSLARIMLPCLPLVAFAAMTMGMLNAQERFAMPAAAPAMFNVVIIGWAVLLWAMGFGPAAVAMGWAVGTLLGAAAQFLIQVPPLWMDGWRFRPEWAPDDPGIRAIASLLAPATVGLAAVQVNIFVSTVFASREPGAVSWLQYAFRILYLPIGVFGVAVGTVAATGLARRAAAGDLDGLRETLRRSISLVAFLTVPASVGLMVLGRPIVRLLFERGRFQALDTENTATALALYAVGLVAYTGVKVLAPAFYALGMPRVPLLASASAVVANLLVIAILHAALGFRAIALGVALGSLLNMAVLAAAFERRVGGLFTRPLAAGLLRMALGALAMAPMVGLGARAIEARVGTHGLLAQALGGLVPVAIGILVYAAASRLLRLPDAHALTIVLGAWVSGEERR
ncbi:MAG: murein biosynthesis integral membrane protein MurJ [Acidobacteria bacterium]|nr:MAG: murein biosynthesis integral membrane protein MurJ [Acidobacteriota bacterium]